MGMDVHGLNPVICKESNSVLLKQVGDCGDEGWFSRWNVLSEDDKREYSKDKEKHEDNNPGIYFRNNVWLWRPLWDFTCYYVGCLTDTDHEQGHYNSGHEISKNKAEQIALTLKELLEDGETDLYKAWYENEIKNDEYEYPFHVDNVRNFAEFCKDSGGFSIQ